MSCLLIDVGNTKLKWRYQSGGSVEYGGFGVDDALRDGFGALKSINGVPSEVALACVKSDGYQQQLATVLFEVFGVRQYFISSFKSNAASLTR